MPAASKGRENCITKKTSRRPPHPFETRDPESVVVFSTRSVVTTGSLPTPCAKSRIICAASVCGNVYR